MSRDLKGEYLFAWPLGSEGGSPVVQAKGIECAKAGSCKWPVKFTRRKSVPLKKWVFWVNGRNKVRLGSDSEAPNI